MSPGVAANAPTANAAVAGVNAVDADEAGPVPAELIAATVTVYSVPLTSPEIVHGPEVQDVSVTVAAIVKALGALRPAFRSQWGDAGQQLLDQVSG